jgi:hypothetical protein
MVELLAIHDFAIRRRRSLRADFAVKTDQGETLAPGESKATSDFVTVYNFYGLVDGSVKSPAGCEFSSEEFGRTPYWNGYPLVLPVDVPGTPNLNRHDRARSRLFSRCVGPCVAGHGTEHGDRA